MNTIILLLNIVIVNGTSIENKYTFEGDFTYQEILNEFAAPTKRSVLGYSEILNTKRNFKINDKIFSIAMDQINKNLNTDGYKLLTDENCFYIIKNDTIKPEKTYKYSTMLPYSNMWELTDDKEEYLNAKEKDKQKYIKDSLQNEYSNIKKNDSLEKKSERKKIYKCELKIIGYTEKNIKQDGIDVANLINGNLDFQIGKKIEMPNINLNINAVSGKTDDKLNFQREIIVYCKGDTVENLVFGSEIRRVNSAISDNNVVKTEYESIYDGLSIKLSSKIYEMIYKIGSDQITLVGVPDSMVCGSSIVEQKTKKRNLLLFRYAVNSHVKFNLISILKVTEVK